MKSSGQSTPDSTEMAAQVLLQNLGYHDIYFEPNGYKKPPDYSMEGNIGVEVTRLERRFQTNQGLKSIESIRKPVDDLLRRWLNAMPDHKQACTVAVQLLFDLEVGIDLKPIKSHLLQSIESSTLAGNFRRRVPVNDKLEFELFRIDQKRDELYKVWGSEGGSGYQIDDPRTTAVRTAIADKAGKMAKIKHDYTHLWLILEDWVAFDTVDPDLCAINISGIEHPFSRIILFSWQNPEQWIDLNV
jgi:hypothetical protein